MPMDPRVADLLAKLTLEQKASLCSGADFWHLKGIEDLGIPSIMVTDGPNGLRKQQGSSDHVGLNDSVPATCFPSLSALASSWDVDLARRVGVALGEECRQEKVAVLLGPGLNIKRSALCGRNFEYLSEDPYLAGKLASALIQGIQSQGVGASPKHFAANNQETRRMSIDAVVDDRALREIYLPAFEEVVKTARPMTLMTAYNQLNGQFCSENDVLLRTILRDEWGFEGLTMTDWGSVNDRVKGLGAGQDLEMPASGGLNDRKLVAAVHEGRLEVRVLDEAVGRILSVILATSEALEGDFRYDPDGHQALAREAAAASAVLLKNEGALPVTPGQTVAVIGRFAKEPRYQGSGSSKVKPSHLENAWDALSAALGSRLVGYADGSDPVAAATLAAKADTAMVFVGLPESFESEGFDRTTLDMPEEHNTLVRALARAAPRTVVILSHGAPVLMPWLGSVNAVLETYLGGQAWGPAVADLITGKTNPSGRLAETFPGSLEDEPCRPDFPGGTLSVAYAESLYVGYRYYSTAGLPVLFPFGHGLSYTTFVWSDLRVTLGLEPQEVRVSLRIRNTGPVAGSEVVQLYVRDLLSAVFRPDRELKGFAKVPLAPGEERTVELTLDSRAFAFWDVGNRSWVVESGDFELLAGASAADIRLQTTVALVSADQVSDAARNQSVRIPEYRSPRRRTFEDLSPSGPFSRLLGRPLPRKDRPPQTAHSPLSTIRDIQDRWLGRLLLRIIRSQMKSVVAQGSDPETLKMMEAMVLEMPLKNLGLMSQGKIGESTVEGLVHILNGRPLKGLGLILGKKTR